MLNLSYYAKRLSTCTKEDKIACIPIIRNLNEYAWEAHRNGLLSLEYKVEKEPDAFLCWCMMLVVDAVDPERMTELMGYALMEKNFSGKDFLGAVLVMQATEMIGAGYKPRLIVAILSEWLGE